MPPVRALVDADHASLVAVATACDQSGVLSVCAPHYLDHVRGTGEVLVTGPAGAVEAYAGTVPRRGATYLTDLFVHPGARDRGHGRALLAAAWDGRTDRVTSSSQDPRAVSGYARFGARPRWPLLYLSLPGGGPGSSRPVEARDALVGDAGWPLALEGAVTALVDDGGRAIAVALRSEDRIRILRAGTPEPSALVDVVDRLRADAGVGGSVTLVVPGPHPALGDLLARGARIDDMDLWCATDGAADLVDPTRELPSPALA